MNILIGYTIGLIVTMVITFLLTLQDKGNRNEIHAGIVIVSLFWPLMWSFAVTFIVARGLWEILEVVYRIISRSDKRGN